MNDKIIVKKDDNGSFGLVAKTEPTEKDTVTLRMISNADIPSVLKPVSCSVGDEYTFSWYLSGCIPVSGLSGETDASVRDSICRGITEACLSAGEFMLDPLSLVLDPDYIFWFYGTGETKLICLPRYEPDDRRSLQARAADVICRLLHGETERGSVAGSVDSGRGSVAGSMNAEMKSVAGTVSALLLHEKTGFRDLLEFIDLKKSNGFSAVVQNRRTGKTFVLTGPDTVIGRAADRGVLCVTDRPCVSRTHARLEYDEGMWTIRDLGTSNGTTVNSKSLGKNISSPLSCGDCFMLADEPFVFYC